MENFSQVWTVLVVLVTRHIRVTTKIKLVKTCTVDFFKDSHYILTQDLISQREAYTSFFDCFRDR